MLLATGRDDESHCHQKRQFDEPTRRVTGLRELCEDAARLYHDPVEPPRFGKQRTSNRVLPKHHFLHRTGLADLLTAPPFHTAIFGEAMDGISPRDWHKKKKKST